jgi:hypothetical protein
VTAELFHKPQGRFASLRDEDISLGLRDEWLGLACLVTKSDETPAAQHGPSNPTAYGAWPAIGEVSAVPRLGENI